MSAKQKGDRKLQGTIGDVTFRRGKKGKYTAHEKVESIAGRIANDPKFIRVRENGAEFARAGAAGKLIRDAIRSVAQLTVRASNARLLTQLLRVIKADPVNDRGLRTVTDGQVELIEGFDFSEIAALSLILTAPFTTTVNRVAGEMILDIPGFTPSHKVKAPNGATHFSITAIALEMDFSTGQYKADAKTTGNLPWNGDPAAGINLVTVVTPATTRQLFLLVGIEYAQFVNGKYYPITSSDFTSLKIVKVDDV